MTTDPLEGRAMRERLERLRLGLASEADPAVMADDDRQREAGER